MKSYCSRSNENCVKSCMVYYLLTCQAFWKLTLTQDTLYMASSIHLNHDSPNMGYNLSMGHTECCHFFKKKIKINLPPLIKCQYLLSLSKCGSITLGFTSISWHTMQTVENYQFKWHLLIYHFLFIIKPDFLHDDMTLTKWQIY